MSASTVVVATILFFLILLLVAVPSGDPPKTKIDRTSADSSLAVQHHATHQYTPAHCNASLSLADELRYTTIIAKTPLPSRGCAADTVRRLFTPTYVTWHCGWWFIVDCWHHRVIFSRQLEASIENWRDLSSDDGDAHRPMIIPHSIASDGRGLLVVESSVGGSNRGSDHSLLAYYMPYPGAVPRFVQEVVLCPPNAARRPHRVEFDPIAGSFFVYLTNPPSVAEVTVVRSATTRGWHTTAPSLQLRRCVPLPFMRNIYARSFAFHNGMMHLTAGPGVISVVNHTSRPPSLFRAYSVKPLGFGKGKMNDIQRIGAWWYATSSGPCSFVRFRSLSTMRPLESLAKKLGLCSSYSRARPRCTGGYPYFVSQPNVTDGRIYVPYIFGCSGVVSFRIGEDEGDEPYDIVQHWGAGWVEQRSDTECWGEM